jgi:hypothetical protein
VVTPVPSKRPDLPPLKVRVLLAQTLKSTPALTEQFCPLEGKPINVKITITTASLTMTFLLKIRKWLITKLPKFMTSILLYMYTFNQEVLIELFTSNPDIC